MTFNLKLPNTHADNVPRGVLLIVSAGLLFAIQDGIAKYLSMLYVPIVLAWMRFLAQTILLGALYGPKLGRDLLKTNVPLLQVYRAFCMAGANLTFLIGLRFIPLGEATAIFFLAPIIVVLISYIFLSEQITSLQWLSIILCISGVLLIVRPGSDVFSLAALLPLASAFCIASYQMLTRKVMATDKAASSNFITSALCCVIIGIPLPFFWTTLPLFVWVIVFIQAIFAMVGHLFMTHSYRHASAAVLAPYTYFQIVFSSLVGVAAFGHYPDIPSAIGIGLVTTGGFVLILQLRSVPTKK